MNQSKYHINHQFADPNSPQNNLESAATIILIRDVSSVSEVFMIKRATKSNFGGAWVFPGGKVDNEDSENNILDYCQGLDDKQASSILSLNEGGLGYWVACVRECFEESGVLLAYRENGHLFKPSLDEKIILNDLRRQLNDDSIVFIDILKKLNLRLALDRILYLSHWVTPKIESRRYSTRFFITSIANDQEAIHDGYEAVDSLWIKIEKALNDYEQGTFPIIMPTIKNLEAIAGYPSTLSILEDKESILPSDILTIVPKFFFEKGKLVGLLPGDTGYEDH
jgi:8-oxo-dGTP pyrophosphatase MutT (NUDIX family)|tara:strand:+ start:94 stop:936 length:843 start_codon:yes stop_codon:yes gene_type:complete